MHIANVRAFFHRHRKWKSSPLVHYSHSIASTAEDMHTSMCIYVRSSFECVVPPPQFFSWNLHLFWWCKCEVWLGFAGRRGYRSRQWDPVVVGARRELSCKKMEGYVATMYLQLKGCVSLYDLQTHTERHTNTNLFNSHLLP